jgi:hypothetical protein
MTAICAESQGIAAGAQASFAERQLNQALRLKRRSCFSRHFGPGPRI